MNKKEEIVRRLSAAQKAAKQLGMKLDTSAEDFIDDKHLDSVWYGGIYAEFFYKNYMIEMCVCGDVHYSWNNGESTYHNRYGDGAMSMTADDSLRSTFASDEALQKAIRNGDIVVVDNNWIEAVMYKQDSNEIWCEVTSHACAENNVLAAIENPSEFMDWIKEEMRNSL